MAFRSKDSAVRCDWD